MAGRGGHVDSYHGSRDKKVHRVTITASSQSLEDLIGSALDTHVEEVELVNASGSSVFFQVDGTAATVNDAPILSGNTYVFVGHKVWLDNVRIIAAGNVGVQLIERIVR